MMQYFFLLFLTNPFFFRIGHSAANAVARIGGFCSPFLIAGDASIFHIGIIMLIVHIVTAFFVSKLPETKNMKLGEVTEDLSQNEMIENGVSMELT